MIAANTLIEVLAWLDTGDPARLEQLRQTLLGWKGSRLRASIAETGVLHLGPRQQNIHADTDLLELERLAQAAALVFHGPPLEHLIQTWDQLSATDPVFHHRVLRSLGEMIPILTQRHESDTAQAGLWLLTCRDALPREGRVDQDAALAEHLYRHFARGDLALAQQLQRWWEKHPDFEIAQKHRVLQTAALLGHWSVIEALFAAGKPYGSAPERRGTRRNARHAQLSDYLIDRMDQEAPQQLQALAQVVAQQLHQDDLDPQPFLQWALALARRAQQPEPSLHLTHALHDISAHTARLASLAHHSDPETAQMAQQTLDLLQEPT